jgi:hypothetical protein
MSNNVEQVTESLFSVSGTSRHSTDKHDLEAGQRVEFRGSGAILSVVLGLRYESARQVVELAP